MACILCPCVVGYTYDLTGGTCDGCGYRFDMIYRGAYLGMEGNQHKFRIHNLSCPECQKPIRFSHTECEDGGIDVTEEFNVMFHRKESHWLGGSNAKR